MALQHTLKHITKREAKFSAFLRLRKVLSWAALLFSLIPLLTDCSDQQECTTTIYGTITDQNQQPVDSIMVMVQGVALLKLGAGGKRGSTVRNNKNKLFKEINLSPSEMGNSYYSYISFNDAASISAHNLIVKAFKDKHKQVPMENIQSRFYINPNGKILEIDFLLRKV